MEPLSLSRGFRLSPFPPRRLQEGRTGVFSWCVISWFYFPWNVNLGNYSSWLVIWRFWMTRKELELLRDFETRVLRIVKVVYGEWLGMRFAIWNLDLALRNFAYFRHSFLGYSKEYPTWLFLWFGKTKFLCPWSVILYLFRSWTRQRPPGTTLCLAAPAVPAAAKSELSQWIDTIIVIFFAVNKRKDVIHTERSENFE